MSENLETENSIKILNNQHLQQGDVETSATNAPPSGNNVTTMDGSGGSDDIRMRKKKTRRGKPKKRYAGNPYVKLTWQQRIDIQKRRGTRRRAKILAHKQALAPYNSNQFLIEDHDHGYLQEIEERLKTRMDRYKNTGQPRTRDSSFSVDSDMDYYSSPEDEEEFLTREFSNTYQDIRTERLNSMTREELIQECVQMENRLEMLTKCLNGGKSPSLNDNKEKDTDISRKDNGIMVDISSMPDFQLEIMKLMDENDALRRENERLRKARGLGKRGSVSTSSISSSIDSESDSSSGSSSSDSDSNNDDDSHSSHENSVSPTPETIDYTKTNGYASSPSPVIEEPSPSAIIVGDAENDTEVSEAIIDDNRVHSTDETQVVAAV